ncbi:tyrosine-protein phosphatase [Loigolactobacillus coryniformis]|nr:tyrosine-protein phosphatase [Loigolactobacillus coryniformis]ATO56321.1 hypothetical protein LC20001_12130 [Loigolactobacillus coryniformis subsp. coryniformis KCTC 3167 = DSM 20001]
MFEKENQSLQIRNGYNFRELGGYFTMDGKKVKKHKLIRAGALDKLAEDELNFLQEYGVRYILDFRTNSEISTKPDIIPNDAITYRIPVFDEMPESNDTNIVKDAYEDSVSKVIMYFKNKPDNVGYSRMLSVYKKLVISSSAQRAYQQFFKLLLANDLDNQALLFHCSAGKDRTGFATYLILSALGVSHKTIINDYLLTNQFILKRVNSRINKFYEAQANENVIKNVRDRLTVHVAYLQSAINYINSQWGGINYYLREYLKVSDKNIASLRKIYLS